MKAFTKYCKYYLQKYKSVIQGVVIGLFLIILFQLIASPIKKYKNWKGELLTYEAGKSLDSVQKLLAFKQALLDASNSDSIYMVISIPDSLLSIHIRGVSIFSTQISDYIQSIFLSELNSQIYQKQFGYAQKAILLHSSIVKEPIKVKIAPKDAMEAAAMATIPDSLTFEPAYINYELQNGTTIQLIAENDLWLSVKTGLLNSANFISDFLMSIARVKIKEYRPTVSIRVDNIDLSSIYRALPQQPYIVVKL
jgi:hypothetical protein